MQSYKQWKLLREARLNESMMNLGLSTTPAVAPIVGQFQYLDEKKKHMDANPEMEDEDMEDVEKADHDEDDVDGDEEEGGCGAKFCKKKMKKKMKKEHCGKDHGDEDEDGDEDVEKAEDDGEDMEGDEGDEGGEEGGLDKKNVPLGFMKKKGMKKKMSKKMKKESATNDFLGQIYNSYAAPENQMSSEDAWWASVQSHFSNPNQKFSDGFTEYLEDYLISPEKADEFRQANDQQNPAPQEPTPGQVGYAPSQRLGWGS